MRIFKGVTMMRQDPLSANIQHPTFEVFSDIDEAPPNKRSCVPCVGGLQVPTPIQVERDLKVIAGSSRGPVCSVCSTAVLLPTAAGH